MAEPLKLTLDLAHTLDKKFVLAFPPPLPPFGPHLPSEEALVEMIKISISGFRTYLENLTNALPAPGLPNLKETPGAWGIGNPQETPQVTSDASIA